jgi:hypothetical protein
MHGSDESSKPATRDPPEFAPGKKKYIKDNQIDHPVWIQAILRI